MPSEIFIGDAAFYVAAAFLLGIIAATLDWSIGFISVIFLFGVAAILAVSKKAAWATWTAIFFAAFFAGAFYFRFYADRQAAAMARLPFGKFMSLTGIVVAEPTESEQYEVLSVAPLGPPSPAISVFLAPGGEFHYGDEIKTGALVEAPETPGDSPAMFPAKATVLAEHKGSWPRAALIDFKNAILEKFNEVLPADEAALLGGETVGGTSGMSSDLKEAMSVSGTSYILSMYGYKIAMLIFFLEAALAGFLARRARFFILSAAVVFFVAMAGAETSAIRAAIMVIMALVAKESGRVFDSRNALALTAVGMALWDPTLLAQASFQLSFLSLAGIMYLSAPLKKIFKWESAGLGILGWREAVVIAIASLLPIVPVIAAAFGDFSLTAFPSNILISFGVMAALIFGFAVAAFGFVFYPLAFFAAKFTEIILWYQLAVIHVFASFVVPLPPWFDSVPSFILYYAILILFVYRYG